MGETSTNTKDSTLQSRDEARTQFGAWFRAARERSGLSIDAIAQETRISRSYISSLESGSMDALPGKVFGRGFVKNITRLLKSDGSEGLRLYDACWGQNYTEISASAESLPDRVAPHKTKSVMARIAEPVDIRSVVSQRLIMSDFTVAGEKPRIPKGNLSQNVMAFLRSPSGLIKTLVSPHVRLWILAAIASTLVLLVFGRWAAVNLHKSSFSTSSIAVKKQVNSGSIPITPSPAAITVEAASQESSAIEDAASTVQMSSPSVPASTVTDLKLEKAASPTQALSQSTQTEIDSSEDNPMYAPSAPGAAFEQVLELNVSSDVEVRITLDGKKVDKTWFEAKSYRFNFNDRAEVYILDASKLDLIYNGKSLGVLGNPGRKRRILLQAKASADDFPK
jgi:cytoskeletal protein RodZ